MYLSVVIPVYNEQDNIKPLIVKLNQALSNIEHEILFVDDGSVDETKRNILQTNQSNIKLIAFSRNFGQTSALAAGIEAAEGEFIATIDGDLQNDPSDIVMMINAIKQHDADIVVGKRINRQDGFILRKIPSLIANYLIRKLTKVKISDYGCTLKIFRAITAKKLDLFGELHRFIPILADIKGAKIIEVEVKHHARLHGYSKYGIGRTIKVASDLLLMFFFQKYRQKPMHLFGNLGIIVFTIGSAIEFYLLIIKIFGQSIGTRPLFYVGMMAIITGVQLITAGFIAELLMRTYYGAKGEKPYEIDKIHLPHNN